MDWEVQFQSHIELTEKLSVAQSTISEATTAAGVVVVLVAVDKVDMLTAVLQGCASMESMSRRSTLLPAFNSSVETLVSTITPLHHTHYCCYMLVSATLNCVHQCNWNACFSYCNVSLLYTYVHCMHARTAM
jgi:hypothetical protein